MTRIALANKLLTTLGKLDEQICADFSQMDWWDYLAMNLWKLGNNKNFVGIIWQKLHLPRWEENLKLAQTLQWGGFDDGVDGGKFNLWSQEELERVK